VQVGDLVKLSSKGNNILWCKVYKNKAGIVVDTQPRNKRLHNIQVMWMNYGSRWVHRAYLKTISRG